jgi:2'-hydroxyisoflavone reductase
VVRIQLPDICSSVEESFTMRLLVLGGTVFLGRHIVEAALARGHEVTLFNRGQHGPELFPQVERLRGDRDGGLEVLRGRSWDAVIDTSGYVPRLVRASAELLDGQVGHYTFVSSLSVYAGYSRVGIDESEPVGTLDDPTVEEVTGAAYGPLKALSEQAAEAGQPDRVLVLRPGLIVGPFDASDRFTYWPRRLDRGGDVLAPGRPQRRVQVVDARDMAEWNVRMAEAGTTGVFNVNGPAGVLTMAEVIDACREAAGSEARPVWVPDEFLLEAGVGPWMELPLWIPENEGMAGFFSVDCSRAIAAGLTFRPILETARDTLAWARAREQSGEPWTPAAGLDPAKERGLLSGAAERAR